jgi:hypothetical protein
MAALGQRFVQYRNPVRATESRRGATKRALGNRKRIEQMRRELRAGVHGLMLDVRQDAREPTEHEEAWLVDLAELVALGRAGVITDRHGNVIDRIEPELPTRLSMELAAILAGMDALGIDRTTALTVIRNTALGCIPAARLRTLNFLLQDGDELDSTKISTGL